MNVNSTKFYISKIEIHFHNSTFILFLHQTLSIILVPYALIHFYLTYLYDFTNKNLITPMMDENWKIQL